MSIGNTHATAGCFKSIGPIWRRNGRNPISVARNPDITDWKNKRYGYSQESMRPGKMPEFESRFGLTRPGANGLSVRITFDGRTTFRAFLPALAQQLDADVVRAFGAKAGVELATRAAETPKDQAEDRGKDQRDDPFVYNICRVRFYFTHADIVVGIDGVTKPGVEHFGVNVR